MYKKILVPIDITEKEQSVRIIDIATGLAADDAEVHVMTVAPTFNMSIVGSFFPEGFEKSALDKTAEALESFIGGLGGRQTVKGHVAHGTVYDEITKVADELSCELIVIGSHRPALKDYLLGPNSARVVRHAKQSVFVVRN